jgi:spore coat-associated protein N
MEGGRPALAVAAGAHGLAAASGRLAAGDVLARTVVLTNRGANPLQSVSATVTPAGSALATHGLELRIDRCSTAWTVAGGALRCQGRSSPVVGWLRMPKAPLQLAGPSGLAPGSRLELRISVRLPAATGNAMEGQEGALQWTFTGA